MDEQETVSVDHSDNILGLGLALTAGIVVSFCAVTSRLLKETPMPVLVFYHTVVGFTFTLVYILVEMWITGNGFRLAQYTSHDYLICLCASAFDAGALIGVTVAYQVDSSGFVALISYMSIVYAYICDQIFFNEHLKAIELIAALVILFVALGVATYKLLQ